MTKKKEERKRLWTREWLAAEHRQNVGAYSCLMNELRIRDPAGFQNFVRLEFDDFQELRDKVAPMTLAGVNFWGGGSHHYISLDQGLRYTKNPIFHSLSRLDREINEILCF